MPVSALAQALPPTGSQADISNPRALEDFEASERERALRRGGWQAPVEDGAAARDDAAIPAGAEAATFVLKTISFDASLVFTEAELDAFAAPYRGRRIAVADLFRIAAAINNAYRERGYVTAQAVLVPQKIADGKVKIALVEGTIGEIVVAGNRRVRSSFVVDRVGVESGVIPTIALLERKIAAVNANRNFQVTAGLKPGAAPGTTDLTLDVSGERKPITGHLYVNNHGSDATGLYNLGGAVSLYSFLGYDELFSVGATVSATNPSDIVRDLEVGSFFADALVPLPKGNGNLRALYSRSNSKVLEGTFASLGISGRGQVFSITLTQPFYTDSIFNFSVLGGYQWSETSSKVGVVDTDTTAQRVFAGVKGQMALHATRTYVDAELRVIRSWVDTTGLSGREHETVTRVVGDATLYQEFDRGFSFKSRLLGQYTPQKRLPSGELWYMGGASTLAAYELSSISGDVGFVASNHLRYTSDSLNKAVADALKVPFSLRARTFFEVGGAFDDFKLAHSADYYADVGVGVDFEIGSHVKGDLAVAWPLDRGSDPRLTVKSPRFLVSLATTF